MMKPLFLRVREAETREADEGWHPSMEEEIGELLLANVLAW